MIHRPGAYELIAGVSTDPTFGPVILFGQGGTAVEIVGDKSLELPPLNTALARAQIERTRIAALLKGFRDRPAADIDGVVNVLVQLSQIVADHAEITEIDINPLLCDPQGVIAVDGRIRVRATTASAQSRFAIRPYPQKLETEIRTLDGQSYVVRPIRPEDEPALRGFADEVDTRDLWHAFFSPLRDRTHETAARLSQIDYDREMTLVPGKMSEWQGSRAQPPIQTSTLRNARSSSAATCGKRAWRGNCWTRFCTQLPGRVSAVQRSSFLPIRHGCSTFPPILVSKLPHLRPMRHKFEPQRLCIPTTPPPRSRSDRLFRWPG
jgi:hypothetical protein